MRISSMHLTEPIPFPWSTFPIGKMDNSQFKWKDEDFIAKTSLLTWPPDQNFPPEDLLGNEIALPE